MKVYVQSIPKTQADIDAWPEEDEICPICKTVFGMKKLVRINSAGKLSDSGTVVHKKCAACTAWSAVAASVKARTKKEAQWKSKK